jgi:8-oxo-dGTP pyrophosphatase MutT (NUDIX family)
MDESVNPWKITDQREVYQNPWIGLTEYQVINPSGGEGIYGKIHFKNCAIAIIPLDDDFNTWLVGQYRFTLNQYSWEIPEGGAPEGEHPLEAAKRELLEETGLKAEQWQVIQTLHLSNSVSDEFGIIYLAQQLSQHQSCPEETEQLAIKKMNFEEAYRLVLDGTITDSLSVAAILKVKLMMNDGQIS